MAGRSRTEILKAIESLPSTRKIFGDVRNWALGAAVVFLVSPELSAAILAGYSLRRVPEHFFVEGKRRQLLNEYHNARGGMEN